MSNQLAGKKVLFITSNTGIERDELVKPLETLKAHGVLVAHGQSDGALPRRSFRTLRKIALSSLRLRWLGSTLRTLMRL